MSGLPSMLVSWMGKSNVNKKCLPLSPCTVLCIRLVTAEKWRANSFVVHASLAMSYQRQEQWVLCCCCLWLILVLSFRNSLCASVDSLHGASLSISHLLLWITLGYRRARRDIAPCCWFGSDRRPADRCLFVFVYLLSGSLNFSTRQLNPLPSNLVQIEQLFCSLPSAAERWQCSRLRNSSLRARKGQ